MPLTWPSSASGPLMRTGLKTLPPLQRSLLILAFFHQRTVSAPEEWITEICIPPKRVRVAGSPGDLVGG